jgi:uncharacterized protein YbdZ (MbtH family)
MTPQADRSMFRVVANDDGECALWPHDRDIPHGWHDTGIHGLEPTCIAFVDEALQRRHCENGPGTENK